MGVEPPDSSAIAQPAGGASSRIGGHVTPPSPGIHIIISPAIRVIAADDSVPHRSEKSRSK